MSTSSSTVCGKPRGTSCGTTATSRASSARGSRVTSRPSSRMQPPEGSSTLDRSLTSVVLPEALGPMTPKVSPALTSKDRSRMAKAPAPGSRGA
jgi:hypothetical protein